MLQRTGAPDDLRVSFARLRRVLLVAALAACSSKAPFGDACTPGATRCNAGQYQRCADDGNSYATIQDCTPVGKVCRMWRLAALSLVIVSES